MKRSSALFLAKCSPWLIALIVVACSSSNKALPNLGAGGGGGDDVTGSGSGNPSGCAGLSACCASIADPTTKMACSMNEQTLAGMANGDQECSAVLAQYEAAGTCAGGVTVSTGSSSTGGGSGCAALSACCAQIVDMTTQQQCMTTESGLAMAQNGDALCAQAEQSYVAANLCGGTSVTTGSSMTTTTSGGPSTTSSTSSGMGGASTSSVSTGSDMGNIIPSTCDQAHGFVGCCGPDGASYYCAMNTMVVTQKICAAGLECGWNAAKLYYSCVTIPAPPPDPNNPINCGP